MKIASRAKGRLLQRLSDPAKSGVYRATHDLDVRNALTGSTHDLASVILRPGKDEMLAAIAQALEFPEWFGGNWDALEDCLADLSWRNGASHVILFYAAPPGEVLGILLDVLAAAAAAWRERGRPFFALFVDPEARLRLPALYRETAR